MLVIPERIWDELLDRFAQQPAGVERVAFLDGYRFANGAVVTTLTIPEADCYPGYYTTSAAAMSAAGRHLRQYTMQRLLQVHTHGNAVLYHSPRDDQMAYSRAPGALSLVLPYHAARRPSPFDGQLHVRDTIGWRAVNRTAAQTMLVLIPSVIDLRRKDSWTPSQAGMPETWAAVFGRYLARIPWPWKSK